LQQLHAAPIRVQIGVLGDGLLNVKGKGLALGQFWFGQLLLFSQLQTLDLGCWTRATHQFASFLKAHPPVPSAF
jgi:hypothetical protein